LAAGIFAYLNSTSGVLPAACFVGMLLCLGIAGVSSANKMAKRKLKLYPQLVLNILTKIQYII